MCYCVINVDKSRISIDSSNIKREAFEKLEFQIDSINNQLYKKVNSLGGKSVVLMDSTSPSDCRDLYTSFARIFCFGAEGLTKFERMTYKNNIYEFFEWFDESNENVGKIRKDVAQLEQEFHNKDS